MSRSWRNLALLVGACAAVDLLAPNAALDAAYTAWVKPVADNRMSEPYIAVLSFMVACGIFTLAKWWIKRRRGTSLVASRATSLAPSDATAKKDDVSVDDGSFINGPVGPWLFWAVSNVGVYLGAIDIFQRVTRYGETLYRVDAHWGAPGDFTATRICLEVLLSVLGYDLLFFVVHKSWHTPGMPRWYRALHDDHHDHYQSVHKPLHVMASFHHHFCDAAVQVMINAGLQQVVGLGTYRHTMSKLLHNMVVTYLIVESHSGMDLPFMTHRWLFPDWWGGAPAHQKHHNTGKAPFHQFWTILDDPH